MVASVENARENGAGSDPACVQIGMSDAVDVTPKAGTVEHIRENLAAADLALSPEVTARLDAMFPPPSGPVSLAML